MHSLLTKREVFRSESQVQGKYRKEVQTVNQKELRLSPYVSLFVCLFELSARGWYTHP